MAVQERRFLQKKLESIISQPPKATLVVGSSILVLFGIVNHLQYYWPPIYYLTLIIPFIPSFFITRIAKIINQRDAEHDFIKDAEPYIFVAFPETLREESLLNTSPVMISNSAARHLKCSIDELLNREALPSAYISEEQRRKIVQLLINNYDKEKGEGSIRRQKVYIERSTEETHLYIMSSKLENKGDKLKWQATLMEYDPLKESEKNAPIPEQSME